MKKTEFEVAIVGGGIIGLMTARELSRSGVQCCVIEANYCGKEASWAGGGIVSPLYPWRYSAPVTALAEWSQQHYRSLCEDLYAESGINPEWIQSGLLILSVKDSAVAQRWADNNQVPFQHCRKDKIPDVQPGLNTHKDAFFFEHVAQVRNPRLMKALLASLNKREVTIFEQSPVTAIKAPIGKHWQLTAGAHHIDAQQVVVCSGAWTGKIMGEFGLSVAVAPVRGQMLMFSPHRHALRRIVLNDGRYLIPRSDGRILCGSTVEYVDFDKNTTNEAFDSLRHSATQIMPSLSSQSIEMHWAGLRPGSNQGIPTIGPVPNYPGLWINAGHFRNGVVLAPASCQLLADLILGRSPIIDASAYALSAADSVIRSSTH